MYPKVYAYYASVAVRFESLNSNIAPGGSFNDLHKRLISRQSVDVILNSSDEVSDVKVVAIGVLAYRFDFLYVFRSQVLVGSSWNFYQVLGGSSWNFYQVLGGSSWNFYVIRRSTPS